MRLLLNIIWLVLAGFWLFLGYMLAALIMCVLIITIPWGIAAARIGRYALWPFGREVVQHPRSGLGSLLGNIVWVVFAGFWLAIEHIVTGVLLCITIIGIPFGIANFKLVPVALMPLGKEIVRSRGRGAFLP
ncbi:YccF domain-containing protein [Gulosibacter sp. 10]|uniref:YccF domain-containing protein n=1 Tax=Gulosibacter sp. 10 TaxID=1255570 RepID=UPI00097E88FF|nr:YccF domain-containing protein [Gulosibacter sp. 10]SJM60604.1 POSSIBLE CONSERVED INTEGRAL MEMBRANE PROTEIN [Gulosibacter sp. 10]